MSKRANRKAVGATWQDDSTSPTLSLEQLAAEGYNLSDIDEGRRLRLVQHSDGSLAYGGFTLTSTGIALQGDVTAQDWQTIGELIFRVNRAIQWLIGDWIVYGEDYQWGQTYEQLAEQTGYTVETLRQYAYVSRHVQLSIRIDNLSFAHHQVVAGLSGDEQIALLTAAAAGGWSVARLRQECGAARERETGILRAQKSSDKNFITVSAAARRAKGAARQQWRQLVIQQIVQWQNLLAELEE